MFCSFIVTCPLWDYYISLIHCTGATVMCSRVTGRWNSFTMLLPCPEQVPVIFTGWAGFCSPWKSSPGRVSAAVLKCHWSLFVLKEANITNGFFHIPVQEQDVGSSWSQCGVRYEGHSKRNCLCMSWDRLCQFLRQWPQLGLLTWKRQTELVRERKMWSTPCLNTGDWP